MAASLQTAEFCYETWGFMYRHERCLRYSDMKQKTASPCRTYESCCTVGCSLVFPSDNGHAFHPRGPASWPCPADVESILSFPNSGANNRGFLETQRPGAMQLLFATLVPRTCAGSWHLGFPAQNSRVDIDSLWTTGRISNDFVISGFQEMSENLISLQNQQALKCQSPETLCMRLHSDHKPIMPSTCPPGQKKREALDPGCRRFTQVTRLCCRTGEVCNHIIGCAHVAESWHKDSAAGRERVSQLGEYCSRCQHG